MFELWIRGGKSNQTVFLRLYITLNINIFLLEYFFEYKKDKYKIIKLSNKNRKFRMKIIFI